MVSPPVSRPFIAAILLIVAAPSVARAWTPLGLQGGTVGAVAVDPLTPTTLYAAVAASGLGDGRGVYKSINGGATWNASSAGIVDLDVREIVVNPQNPATVYIAHSTGGVSRSTNGGASWSQISGVSFGSFADFVINPASPATLYVAGSQGVYKSANSGGTFTPSNSGLTSTNIRALAIDPVNPAVLYVSTFDGVFKSTDSAATWSPSNTGLPANGPNVLAVDPATPSIVYAAGCAFGVYRSVDGGATWSPNVTGLPSATPCARALAARPSASGTVYLAATDDATQTVFKSTDSGATWSASGGGLEGHVIADFAFDPGATPIVYAGTASGFFKSTDDGATWSRSMAGIRHAYMQALAVDPNAPATLYAAGASDGPGSVAKSIDGGVSWTQIGPLSRAPLESTAIELVIWRVVIDPTNSLRVYLAGDGGVFRSADGGATWAFGAAQGSSPVFWLAVDPLAPMVLYASTQGSGVQKSIDGGATWTVMNAGLPNLYSVSVLTDPQHANTVYASVAFQGVFKSVDGAASWTAVNSGLQNVSFTYFGNLVMDPTNADVLYVVASTTPYRTANGGGSWTTTASSGGGYSLIIDPVVPTNLYAVSDYLVVDKSTDSGATWTSISPAGLPTASIIQSIAIDPGTGTTLYAATLDGVFKSGTSTSVCMSSADCNDGDLCTTDVCDPDDSGADLNTGCVNPPIVCDPQCHSSAGFCDSQTGECMYSSPPLPDGTPCDDGNLCTFDRCIDGQCEGNPVPEPTCHSTGATGLILRRNANPERSSLVWKWNRGETSLSDFGNPIVSGTQYTLCIYDRSGPGGDSAGVLSAAAPSGVLNCGGRPCWQVNQSGFKYKDRAGTADGLTDIKLHAGVLPKAKVLVKARGARLEPPPLPMAPTVTVQLRRSGNPPDCWGAEYQGLDIRQNDGSGFKGKTR